MELSYWENLFEERIRKSPNGDDPAHDILHVKRVVSLAGRLCAIEGGKIEIVTPAAWLHDFVVVPKDSSLRKQASKLSAEAAIEFLDSIHYPAQYFDEIFHAIEAHSFSANIKAKSIEAKIVQDADRLDGIGAIGIARCFATSGLLKRAFYEPADPFCKKRAPDDLNFTMDHFFKKLFRIPETLQTHAGRLEAQQRVKVMESYLESLARELMEP